jgi:hypothetical protein
MLAGKELTIACVSGYSRPCLRSGCSCTYFPPPTYFSFERPLVLYIGSTQMPGANGDVVSLPWQWHVYKTSDRNGGEAAN